MSTQCTNHYWCPCIQPLTTNQALPYNAIITHHYPGIMWTHPRANTPSCSDNPPIAPPTDSPTLVTTQNPLPCEDDRCTLYASANMCRSAIIGRALFFPVCMIFNHATKHTHHIERALKARSRLRPMNTYPGYTNWYHPNSQYTTYSPATPNAEHQTPTQKSTLPTLTILIFRMNNLLFFEIIHAKLL